MDVATSLQIPDASFSGPSRQQYSVSRPASVQPAMQAPQQQSSRRQRASHNIPTTSQQQQQQSQTDENSNQSNYRDVYSHPAAVAYAAAHPRRTIPKFGPYLLLQTLGEGEFGKVKLGLHSQWGEEVAVKLIRRGHIDTSVRMSKVEREIEVLRNLKHPNIVRLYDVIETDKYIGIILEYASGGELFDHILAHRYLKEKDAAKLFSQLLSGVAYIHAKKIVHRDLKLENLLLDRHRNVIITDFGFANRFEHRADDLMQTSCGSPCYAAPELVISEGLYVGSAVDIWSCGVILYAMLAGYLPFDDDPANPDGDNINLLYKYIVNTPLSFPDYISEQARDLLGLMLVPDPSRRADLQSIMAHPWLSAWSHYFDRSVEELERAAMEQHQAKRLAYQRQMKQAALAAQESNKVARSQSTRNDVFSSPMGPSSSPSRSRSHRDHTQQPEYLYETSADQSMHTPAVTSSSRKGVSSAIVLPTTTHESVDDDPFGPTSSRDAVPGVVIPSPDDLAPRPRRSEERSKRSVPPPAGPAATPSRTSQEAKKPASGFRHTIQVEVGEEKPEVTTTPSRKNSESEKTKSRTPNKERSASVSQQGTPTAPVRERQTGRRPSGDVQYRGSSKPLPVAPSSWSDRVPPPQVSPTTSRVEPPALSVESPPSTPSAADGRSPQGKKSIDTNGSGSQKSRHRKGLSVDKLGLGKLFGASPEDKGQMTNGTRIPSEGSGQAVSVSSDGDKEMSSATNGKRPATYQAGTDTSHPSQTSLLTPSSASAQTPSAKKGRRNTLIVSINQTIKSRTKGRGAETPVRPTHAPIEPKSAMEPAAPARDYSKANISRTEIGGPGTGMHASTSKARKVMQWFRTKSKGGEADELGEVSDTGAEKRYAAQEAFDTHEHEPEAAAPVQVQVTTPTDDVYRSSSRAKRPPSTATERSFSRRVRDTVTSVVPTPAKSGLAGMRIHHGAVDQTTITTGAPPDVMQHVRDVLLEMGVKIHQESEYKIRCIREKRRKGAGPVGLGLREASGSGNGLAAFSMSGTAASNGVDKRGLPQPSHPSFGATGGMLKGLLMRRQSSQVSSSGTAGGDPYETDDPLSAGTQADMTMGEPTSPTQEPIYGDSTHDAGDEVRFYVELTRLDRLDDTYSLDIRRLKGNLRSYKFLYDTLRGRANLQR